MNAEAQKKRRNPFLAAISSLGVVGLGQLYNGRHKKAAIAYILWLCAAAFIVFAPVASSPGWMIIAMALPLLLSIIFIVDAFRDALIVGETRLHPYNRWYVYLAILLIHCLLTSQVLVGLATISFRAYKIPTQSMSPTIEMGDALIADMKAYKNKTPSRRDLIVFKHPLRESVPYLKRLIGLPGEVLEIRGRTVYINGQPLKEDYVKYLDPRSTSEHFGPIAIPADQFFVLGDSRDNSQDSRYWGPVKRSQILGQARYLYWAKDKSRVGRMLY